MAPLIPALAVLLLALPASAQDQAHQQKPKFDRSKTDKGESVAGKPLDLSSLFNGQHIAGPDPNGGASAGPDKYTKMVLAAVDQIAGNPYSVRARFGQAFGTTITAEAVQEAATAIRSQIKLRKIQVVDGEKMGGVAAYWQPEPDQAGDWLVGKMGVKKSLLDARAAEYRKIQGSPSFSFNCGVDQIANSVLHETVHIFFTFFARRKGLQSKPSAVAETFTANYHWNGVVQVLSGGSGPQSAGSCKRDPNKQGYTYFLSNAGYGQSSDEDSARYVAAQLQESTQGDALKAVLREIW